MPTAVYIEIQQLIVKLVRKCKGFKTAKQSEKDEQRTRITSSSAKTTTTKPECGTVIKIDRELLGTMECPRIDLHTNNRLSMKEIQRNSMMESQRVQQFVVNCVSL